MKIVIQCAATKNPTGAGFHTDDKRLVRFVACPELAPISDKYFYARPDDRSDDSQTWRERLLEQNRNSQNPLGLTPAYQLYANGTYERLVKKFGLENVFILSAGWGLISADFLTPDYDITFSQAKNVAPWCRRKKLDPYADSCLLPNDGDNVIFLGGKDYLPLFMRLTAGLRGVKKIFFNSMTAPTLGKGFTSEKFLTSQRTNWHYPCAQALIDGQIGV